MERDKANMAKDYIINKAIEDAAFILERIDSGIGNSRFFKLRFLHNFDAIADRRGEKTA
jgi:hypothetical protein